MGIGTLSADMTEDRFIRCEGKYFRHLDVCLIPLKYEKTSILQYTEAFGKADGKPPTALR